MIDLHVHSTCSDGTYPPAGLARLAANIGLAALALTDHDTVAGVVDASLACSRLGIRFIPGVELEVDYAGGEFHLLGLAMTASPPAMEADLREMKKRRHRRNLQIVSKMVDDGVQVDLETVEAFSEGEVLGRPHFARFLVHRGIARSVQDAFDRFLGRDKKYYHPIERLTVDECAEIIHRAGGRTIIAHPLSLGLQIDELERRLLEWKARGVDGIEAFHSNAPLETCQALESLARRHGLIVTAGSDFHGGTRPDRVLGHAAGGMEIADGFLDELLVGRT